MAKKATILEKYGRSSTTNAEGMDIVRIDEYVDRIAMLRDEYGFIVVASGSIALGTTMWRRMRPNEPLPNEQSLAMLGSPGSSLAWQTSFARHDMLAGQLPITQRSIKDPIEGATLRTVLRDNLQIGMVTIGNGNDAISDFEMKAYDMNNDTDNDILSVVLAKAGDVNEVFFRTDKEGLLNEQHELLRRVDSHNIDMAKNLAGIVDGKVDGNGMGTKVLAAYALSQQGINVHICHADASFEAVFAGDTGTFFPAA